MTSATFDLSSSSVADDALRRVEAWMRHEQARRQLYGDAACIDRVSETGGGDFRYAYDLAGDLTAIVEANGYTRRYAYDAQRRLLAVLHDEDASKRYRYDTQDRLEMIDDQGIVTRYTYDTQGRIARVQHGADEVSVYQYDDQGRVVQARTSQVATCWHYDDTGRVTSIEQSIGGVTLAAGMTYDADGRMASLSLPGSHRPIRYTWDQRGRPKSVALDEWVLAMFHFDDARRRTCIDYANRVSVESTARPIDGRAAHLGVRRAGDLLQARILQYNDLGEIVSDGEQRYGYDSLGRLASAQHVGDGTMTTFGYDALDNLVERTTLEGTTCFVVDNAGRLASGTNSGNAPMRFTYDRWGRLAYKSGSDGAWNYRYDDAGLLQEVRRNGEIVAFFLYDHKGRLAAATVGGRTERYLYGVADELLAVTDGSGKPLRLIVRTPLGALAEVQGAIGEGEVYFRHDDERGTTRLVTDKAGDVIVRMDYDPFGLPLAEPTGAESIVAHLTPVFTGRSWFQQLGLYYFGARWYDPALGRFLTPDSYTGAPDDARLLNPLRPSSRQAAVRMQILGAWLKQPRVRNPYAFCANDPIGRVDPNGHWSFGGVLLMLLGAIWTLPNTLFGLLIEITCLVGEVIRWLVWLFSFGHVSWETPGFDVAASGNLNAFALVFSGGWLGSFSNLLGITFGNVFFVYKQWPTSPHITSLPDPVFPLAYNGSVSIPRDKMLYEHELRHTNQYGWLGPFFHLGLPLFGFYEWDVIINGYQDAWTERDARAHAEP